MMAYYETNRQVIHLSKAKRCSDQADHLCRVVRNCGTRGRVSGAAGQPGTYIRCNFHSARLIPELIAGAEGPFGNRPWFFMVLRTSLSYALCNEHRRFRRFCPTKRPQTIDLSDQFRKSAATYRTHSIAGRVVNFERSLASSDIDPEGVNRSDNTAMKNRPRQVRTRPPTIGGHAVLPELGRASRG
jgi:hypothetical protein